MAHSPATLANAFDHKSSATAVIVPGDKPLYISYKQLSDDVVAFQTQLAKLGIGPEAAVSISLPNSYPLIVAFLAASWQRAIAAPLNAAYKQEEVEFYVSDLGSSVILVPKGAVQADSAAVRAARKYKAAVVETYLDGARVVFDVKETGKLNGHGNKRVETAQPEDVALVLHTSGFLAPLGSGGSVIVPGGFSASKFWHDFITFKANWYTAVPTMHQILLSNPPPNPKPSIRFIRSCSSPLSPTVLGLLESTYDAPVLEAYAMTEAAHQMTSNPLPPAKHIPGSVGIGHGTDIRIMDGDGKEVPRGTEAEICVKGENVTKGYLNNPEANKSSFTKEGYFRTGDQGKQDADGYIYITGRMKELINRGGEKISPIELDNVFARHPAVAEAVSFAIPDDMYGQEGALAVVLKPGKKVTAQELKSWASEKLAKHKLPKKIYFTEVMPKTATGKIQRKNVAEAMAKMDQPQARL